MDLESFVQIENRLSGAGKHDVCVGVNVVVDVFGGVDTLFEADGRLQSHFSAHLDDPVCVNPIPPS